MDDPALVAEARSGAVEAFEVIYRRHAPVVMRFAWAKLGDRPTAEDVLQDTFILAWRKRREMPQVESSLLPWLLAIAANHARNASRHRTRCATVPLDENHPDVASGPVEVAAIAEALGALSPTERRICHLCLIEGYSYREAAAQLGITEGAVRKRLQRARASLRESLNDND
ncbi:RNA polymerase sigma factor [Gryllotalpicola reticulitermitis]|uniref:RNA polymerase sigma factor n=1 Tax=Gryllotalpicola reticulitermitis TaxID=1184153 RepID=A0ABV8Q3E9_9MICO